MPREELHSRAYSRRQYVQFVEKQDFATTIRDHVRAFEYFDGLCTCLYDNMKVVVTGYDGDQPIYNTRFLSFATHYGYQPWACCPHRPIVPAYVRIVREMEPGVTVVVGALGTEPATSDHYGLNWLELRSG